MPYENVLLEKANGIATITLNRPPAHALSMAHLRDIGAAFDEVEKDDSVRVVIVTGGGDKFFCGGAEIKEFGMVDAIEQCKMGQDLFRRIEMFCKPVIAAVNGFALGGGCELAMSCHMRYAADTAKLGQPEINLGIIPGWGGTQRLPRLVGRGAAIEMMLLGDPIPAAEALRLGLVNRVVPAAELRATVQKLAERIAAAAPLAAQSILECVDAGMRSGMSEGIETERDKFQWIGKTEDAQNGIKAFLSKQKTVFKGK